MNENLVSIVLPIYNVEKYLNRCIESVINQTYDNIEIILVDDGSPDNCPQLCDEWATRDMRIKVVHKRNEGLGMARNTGIKYATGKYICFLDSDDYIEPYTIEKCIECIKENNPDVVCFGYTDISASGKTIKEHKPCSEKGIYRGIEIEQKFLPELLMRKSMNINMTAWSAMYKMELINKIHWQFVSEREVISEDVYSLLHLYKFVGSVAIVEDCLYNYCENAASLTRVYKENRYNKIKAFYISCIELSNTLGYEDNIRNSLVYPYLANTIAALKQIVGADVPFFKKTKILCEILEDGVLQDVMNQLDFKRERSGRRCLFAAIRNKMVVLCYVLLRIKGQKKCNALKRRS